MTHNFSDTTYIVTGVAVVAVGTVATLWALNSTATGSFRLSLSVPAPKAKLFASEINPATYWKFARKGYRPPENQVMHSDGLGSNYELVDRFLGHTIRTPLTLRWSLPTAEPADLQFDWVLTGNVKVNTHWKYYTESADSTRMEVTQTLTGPRWKVWFFASPLAQMDFKHRMNGVYKHFAGTK